MTVLLAGNSLSPDGLSQSLALALLLCARLAPIAWLVPWASVRGATSLLPVLVTVVLAVCLWPVASAVPPTLPLSPLALLVFAVREALLGVVYAFALALPIQALQWSGVLVGRASLAPSAETGYASLQRALGVAVFFALGGHRLAITALADGILRRPLGMLSAFDNPSALALGSARLLGDAFASALLLALPVIAALMLADLVIALAARTASAPAFALALAPARAALALLLMWMTVMLWLGSAPDTLRRWFTATKLLWNAI